MRDVRDSFELTLGNAQVSLCFEHLRAFCAREVAVLRDKPLNPTRQNANTNPVTARTAHKISKRVLI